jgi:hypothetical protein
MKTLDNPQRIDKMLYASHQHLSNHEWLYAEPWGRWEWPAGEVGPWFRSLDDLTIMVGQGLDEPLTEQDLAGVSPGLAGVIRLAWKQGASWVHFWKHGEIFDDIPWGEENEGNVA